MYAYNFILKQTGQCSWTLYSAKNNVEIYTFNHCHSEQDAVEQARAWTSSWNSVNITVVKDVKKDKRN